MTSSSLLTVVVDRWVRTLGRTEFKIVAYLYRIAAATPDGRIDKSIEEIAQATNLAWRTVQKKLKALDTDGVIKVISDDKERTLIEIPLEYWPLPAGNSEPAVVEPPVINPEPVIGPNPEPVVEPPVIKPEPVVEPPASIEELVRSLAGQRPSAEALALMKAAAGNDERLQDCLNSFLLLPKSRWATVDGLTVSVQHYFRVRDPRTKYWTRP